MLTLIRPDNLVGMVSGLMVWALHLTAVYALTGVGCNTGLADTHLLGINILLLLLGVMTLVAFGLLYMISLRGWRGWRRARRRPAQEDGERQDRRRFMGLIMLILGILAFVATLFTSIPIFLLPPCR